MGPAAVGQQPPAGSARVARTRTRAQAQRSRRRRSEIATTGTAATGLDGAAGSTRASGPRQKFRLLHGTAVDGYPPDDDEIPPATAHQGASTTSVHATVSLTHVLYLQETGDPALISVSDINQGQIGD